MDTLVTSTFLPFKNNAAMNKGMQISLYVPDFSSLGKRDVFFKKSPWLPGT